MYVERGSLPSLEFGGLFHRVGYGATICNLGIEASVINVQEQCPEGQTNDARWYYWGDGTYLVENAAMLADWVDGGDGATTISQCYTQGTIYMPTDDDRAGAFTGQSASSTTNCYARVDIYLKDYPNPIGSFIGGSYNSDMIQNCYSAGRTRDGGDWYFDKELAPDKQGYSTGKTTNEMKSKSTYKGWDFETIWGRNNSINDGYPYLRLFHPDAPADDPDPVKVTGIVLEEAGQTKYLVAGGQVQLHAHMLPEDAVVKK